MALWDVPTYTGGVHCAVSGDSLLVIVTVNLLKIGTTPSWIYSYQIIFSIFFKLVQLFHSLSKYPLATAELPPGVQPLVGNHCSRQCLLQSLFPSLTPSNSSSSLDSNPFVLHYKEHNKATMQCDDF